jgi:hypothetical protein
MLHSARISHPGIPATCEISSKVSFLGRDECKFSQEKVLMRSLSHHHQYIIVMTKIMGNIMDLPSLRLTGGERSITLERTTLEVCGWGRYEITEYPKVEEYTGHRLLRDACQKI